MRFEVTQKRLSRGLNVVRFLEVISNLPHQSVLGGGGELRTAFLMAASELVHLFNSLFPFQRQPRWSSLA